MSNLIRSLIEGKLETMEAGIFQDFCLEFLPIFDDRYSGLSRLGHTPGGKTRPGTPDLLLTNEDGSQIGVQCGTEEDYWICPQNKENWKPLVDAQKCIDKLKNLVEIVLIANREIPPRYPNTKANIFDSLKDKTGGGITLFAREDIGQVISTNLWVSSTKRLIEKYFPEAFKAHLDEPDAQRWRILKEVASERSIDNRTIFTHIENALKTGGNQEGVKEIIIRELDSFNYRLNPVPSFDGVYRSPF